MTDITDAGALVNWYDDGWRVCIVVSAGRKHVTLLRLASLETLKVPAGDYGRARPALIDKPSRWTARRLRRQAAHWRKYRPTRAVKTARALAKKLESRP